MSLHIRFIYYTYTLYYIPYISTGVVYNYMGNNIYHPGYVSTCENGDETKENVPNYLRKQLKNTPQKRRTPNKRSFFLNKNSILRMRV